VSKPLIALSAAFALLAIIVAGCGGGSDSTGTEATTSSLTKAEFLKQGNAICAKGNTEIEEGFEEFAKEHNFSQKSQPSKAELEEAVETIVIPKVRRQVEGIAALGVPSEGGKEAEEVLAAAEKALEEGEENPALMAGEGDDPFAKVNKMAKEFGLVKCAEGEGEEG
jgi:hypothetical protein